MDKRFGRARINAITTLSYQVVSMLSGFLIPWLLIDVFGSEIYGATTSIAQLLTYIALFEGGIGRVARGALYEPLASKKEDEISGIYLAIKKFFFILGMVFLGYAIILAIFYYDISGISVFTRWYTFALVLSIAVGKFAEYMGGISNITLFNADQRLYVVNLVNILSTILNVICVIILSSAGVDILWVKLVSSFVFILKPIIFTLYLKTHYNIKKSKSHRVLKNKITGIAQHTAYVVQNNTDILILTIFSDLKYVAVYSIYHLVCFSLRNITTSFTGGMEAVFGDMVAKKEQELLKKTYYRYKFILTFLSLTFFGTAGALIVSFVALYTSGTTDVNYIQPIFALILLLGEALNCIILPCFNLPIAANQLKNCQWGAYPLIGVALGTLISVIFKSVYYIVYSGKNILNVKVGFLIKNFFITVVSLFFICFIGMIVFSHIEILNYFMWIISGFCTIIIVSIFSILVCKMLYPGVVKEYINSAIRKIRIARNSYVK